MTLRSSDAVPPIVLLLAQIVDPVAAVGQRGGAGDVGADIVASNDVARRTRVHDRHPIDRVPRNYVPLVRVLRPINSVDAQPVVGGPAAQPHAVAVATEGGRPAAFVPIKLPAITLPVVPVP